MKKRSVVYMERQLEKVLGVRLEDPREIVAEMASIPNRIFMTLREDLQEYVNAMTFHVSRGEAVLSIEEYVRQAKIKEAPSELPPAKSTRRSNIPANHEIAKALLSAKAIIPSSFDIRQSYGISARAAIDLRWNVVFVLKVLRDLELYVHPTLEDSINLAQLRRKPRGKNKE